MLIVKTMKELMEEKDLQTADGKRPLIAMDNKDIRTFSDLKDFVEWMPEGTIASVEIKVVFEGE